MSNITNFFPIQFSSNNFSIQRVEYTKEKLRELREKYNQTHSFFRRDDFIYISPMSGVSLEIGETKKINVQANPEIVSSLIKHIFFRVFRDRYKNIIPLSFYPFRFLSRKDEDDLLYNFLGPDLKGILSYKKQIEVQFRQVENQGQVQFGAIININYQWMFSKSCDQLVDEGFDILGLNVLLSESIPGLDGIIAPDESLVGPVTSIKERTATVDTNYGPKEYSLENLFLQKTFSNIQSYLSFKLGEEKARNLFGRIRKSDITRLNAKGYFSEIKKIADLLGSLKYKNDHDFGFSISNSASPIPSSFTIYPPNFIFDYNPGASHPKPSSGLLNYGPYDSSTFDLKHPEVLVVCHRSNRGAFAEFCGKLRDGIPSSYIFKGGMKGKYRLHDITFRFIELDN